MATFNKNIELNSLPRENTPNLGKVTPTSKPPKELITEKIEDWFGCC